jgi:hypothetical protein
MMAQTSPWQLAIANLTPPAASWQPIFSTTKARPNGIVPKPASQATIREQCAQILGVLAHGELSTPDIITRTGLYESIIARRLELLRDKNSITKRIAISKTAPHRLAMWRLA